MKKSAISLLLVGLLCASPAWSLTLDEARVQGKVGETLSGYLAPRSPDADTLALVQQVNQGREQNYRTLASIHNLKIEDVAELAGQKLVSRAASGEYVKGINGQWIQKP